MSASSATLASLLVLLSQTPEAGVGNATSVTTRITDAQLFPCDGEGCSVLTAELQIINASNALVCIPAIYGSPAADGISLKAPDGIFHGLNNPGPIFSRFPREASPGYADMPQHVVQPGSTWTLSIRLDLGWDPDRPPGIDPKIDYQKVFVRLLWRPCTMPPGGSREYEVVDLEHPLS